MSIFIRIWFFFSLVVVLSLSFIAYTLTQQVKPNVRQVVEDTLAENANIIAQLIAEDVHQQQVNTPEFDQKIQAALSRQLDATIWQHKKNQINQQLYITDQHGIVIYDSEGKAVGQDYSKWNDVYLTLLANTAHVLLQPILMTAIVVSCTLLHQLSINNNYSVW